MSNNEKFELLQVDSCFLFLLMGVPWRMRRYVGCSTMTNMLKSTLKKHVEKFDRILVYSQE